MTDQELKDIVAAVVAELEKSGVDFDYKAEQAEDDDLVFVIRGTAPNYQGVTVTWKGLLDIITAQATQAKNDAETAKNTANTILEQVQSKGTEITNFVATSKTEIETQKNESVNAVKSVYQTDLDELKGDLVDLIDNQKTWVLKSKNLETGYILDDGTEGTHPSRFRTKFLRIRKGSVLFGKRLGDDNDGLWGARVNVYDESKNHVELKNWGNLTAFAGGIKFDLDGYIRISVQGLSISDYDNRFSIISFNLKSEDKLLLYNEIDFETITSNMLRYGYYSSDGTILDSNKRATNALPIKVKKGDEIHVTDKSVLFDGSIGTSKNFRGIYNRIPLKAIEDGFAYINLKNADDSTVFIDSFDMALKIKKAEHIGKEEFFTVDMLCNGYFDGNYVIQNANHRVVSFDYIHANKGDRVRFKNQTIGLFVHEFDSKGNRVGGTSSARVPYGKSTGISDIGDYIVAHNDVWIAIQMYAINSPSSAMNVADYENAVSIIHTEASDYKAPKSCKKPRIINIDGFREMQDGTIINGKLWASFDDYAGNTTIKVIDIESGTVEKTITHDFGHAGSLDYNNNNDCLLICSGGIYIYHNASAIGESLNKADDNCIQINVDSSITASGCCWGADDQTIYVVCGYDGNEDINKIWKIILSKSNGEYTGESTLMCTFNFNPIPNGNYRALKNDRGYTQGCEFDGYLYLGFGTTSHNFLVIDLDEDSENATIVGNYMYKRYTESRIEENLEPQIVALNGNKIILGAREWESGISTLLEFDRTI